jgi:tetratricopeptide (TPR) repeat protein
MQGVYVVLSILEITNYQSHRSTRFDFGSGVNALTGSSNSGKSAGLRALNWVINSKPDGESFLSFWVWNEKGKQIAPTSVKLTLDNGTVIERVRDAERNCYIINGKQLDALNRSVPPEVAEALNFSETNLQKQFGAPFLLTDSAGEVGKFFNKIAHFDAIDRYQSTIESKRRSTNAELKLVRENLERVDEDLKKFEWIPMAQKLLKKIEELGKINEDTECVVGELKEALDLWERQQKVLEQTAVIGDAEKLVTNCTQLQLSVEDLEHKISNISNMVKSYDDAQGTIDKYDFIEAAEQLVLGISPALFFEESTKTKISTLTQFVEDYGTQNGLLKTTEQLPMAEKLVNKITMLGDESKETMAKIFSLTNITDQYKINKNVVDMFEREYEELQGQLPPNCPTCGALLEKV